jgi:uncharacterized protein
VLRPIGSGLPLGFFAFGIGMLLLACSSIGWIPLDEQHQVGMMLISFVFPLELVATIFAFLARDTLGATTLGLFATSWLALGWADLAAEPGAKSVTLGIYLFGFSALLLCAAARMVLSGVYEVGDAGKGFLHAAGWIALALSGLAMYGATALGLEDAHQRELLPLFRRGQAAESFAGFDAQLDRLEAEPGVRQQL